MTNFGQLKNEKRSENKNACFKEIKKNPLKTTFIAAVVSISDTVADRLVGSWAHLVGGVGSRFLFWLQCRDLEQVYDMHNCATPAVVAVVSG